VGISPNLQLAAVGDGDELMRFWGEKSKVKVTAWPNMGR